MTCKWCNGTGRIYVELGSSIKYVCTDCAGTGFIPDVETDVEQDATNDTPDD